MLVTAGSHFECAAQAVEESEAALNEAVTRTEQSQRENSLLKGSVSSKKQQLEQAMANGKHSKVSRKRASLAVAQRLLASSAALKEQNEQEQAERKKSLAEKVAKAEALHLEVLAAQHSAVVAIQAKAREPAAPSHESSIEEQAEVTQLQQQMAKPLNEQAKGAALMKDTAADKEQAAQEVNQSCSV